MATYPLQRYPDSVTFHETVQRHLSKLDSDGLLRTPRTIRGPQSPVLTVDGKTAISLCSNNYLGLANHPELAAAMTTALHQVGTGSGASRHISGTATLHLQAQDALARHVHLPAALLFSTGYAANVGTLQALLSRHDLVFSDQLNHASLIDGIRLSRSRAHVYRHNDLEHLQALLHTHRERGDIALVVTDAIFSMDGDLAHLRALRDLCDRYDAALMVDEAHSLGICGPKGAGLCVQEGVKPDILIGTLGKAFGLSGAFAAGQPETIRLLENRARSYVFSTAPPPALAAATLKAIELVQQADQARATLRERSHQLRTGIASLGYQVVPTQTPIIPVMVGEPQPTMALSRALLEHGAFVHGIRPPTVPPGTSRLRVTTMATHSEDHIHQALAAFAAAACKTK